MALRLSSMSIKKEEKQSAKFEMHLTDESTEKFVAMDATVLQRSCYFIKTGLKTEAATLNYLYLCFNGL